MRINISTESHQNTCTDVDWDDMKAVGLHKWFPVKHHTGKLYVNGKVGGKSMKLHNYLMKPPAGMIVDHVNGDTLDNRRDNLRICTREQNARNRATNKTNKCGYKGVDWCEHIKKWRSRISVNKKTIHIGVYEEIEDAVMAYNEAAVRLHGEYARLNVI